eukprot:SAG31_NODE_4642_length_3076_cov_76.513268_4_plen_52_part_00
MSITGAPVGLPREGAGQVDPPERKVGSYSCTKFRRDERYRYSSTEKPGGLF